ncbi:hypothetical protein FH972_017923 [Carpinus fangiana]|uniref:Uncharacterized protein n=1 Tax=Carpinus fangiana TaxID=176857 RepID=A0A5N6RKM1_9ROSI|nr:hypothetical protein FH972_017923 [Carpinus fangiana]
MVRPLVVLGGNNVDVGVEKDCGEAGIGVGPFEEDQRLAFHELQGLRLERDGLGLGEDEIGRFSVLGARLGCVDSEVLLES